MKLSVIFPKKEIHISDAPGALYGETRRFDGQKDSTMPDVGKSAWTGLKGWYPFGRG